MMRSLSVSRLLVASSRIRIGAFFNTLNLGQVLTLHIVVLPLAVAAEPGAHGGQEVAHLHVHLFGGAPLGRMIA